MRYLYENNPEQYAKEIVEELKLTPPIDIFKVCRTYDVRVNYEDINSAEAFLIVSNGKKNIIINDKKILYIPRQRFTIAHELGNFFIPWHRNRYKCSAIGNFNPDNLEENQADIFASELLIPTNILLPKIEGKTVTLELIKELSQEFNVSLGAMARKIILNTEDKVVALFYYSNGNKIVQAKSDSFNYELRNGIIEDSGAREILNTRYSNECVKRILGYHAWFQDSENEENIVEESLCQPRYNRVFTMLRRAKDTDYIDAYFDI